MRVTFWTHKATKTHPEPVLLTVLQLQQLLHERTSLLRYTYIACLVCMVLRTNSVYVATHHYLIGFYNRKGACLLRGTD
jgi:hypothetical protein